MKYQIKVSGCDTKAINNLKEEMDSRFTLHDHKLSNLGVLAPEVQVNIFVYEIGDIKNFYEMQNIIDRNINFETAYGSTIGVKPIGLTLIEEMNFTKSTYIALKRYGINNVQEILDLGEDINRVRNLGKARIKEIEDKIKGLF